MNGLYSLLTTSYILINVAGRPATEGTFDSVVPMTVDRFAELGAVKRLSRPDLFLGIYLENARVDSSVLIVNG